MFTSAWLDEAAILDHVKAARRCDDAAAREEYLDACRAGALSVERQPMPGDAWGPISVEAWCSAAWWLACDGLFHLTFSARFRQVNYRRARRAEVFGLWPLNLTPQTVAKQRRDRQREAIRELLLAGHNPITTKLKRKAFRRLLLEKVGEPDDAAGYGDRWVDRLTDIIWAQLKGP